MTRPDTAKRNSTPEHRAAVVAGQQRRWAKHHRTADARALKLIERRAKTPRSEIHAKAEARRAAIAAAKFTATLAAPMRLSDWKAEYRFWAADLREAGDYIGPDFAIFLPRDRQAAANRRLGYGPPAGPHHRRGELDPAKDHGHKARRHQWAEAVAGPAAREYRP